MTYRFHAQRWLVLMVLVAIGFGLPCITLAQGIGFAGEDPLTYGAMYRTYARQHGELVTAYGEQIKTMRAQGATPGELYQAYEQFMKASLVLDTRYKQPLTQKLLDVTNLRVANVVDTAPGVPARPGVVNPSTPITGSAGTRPGEKNYRAGFADTDAAGGARAVDHLERVAIEMGLTPDERATLFERRPGYTTVDNDVLVTAHKSGRLDRVGSEAWHTQIQVDAAQPETYLSAGMRPRPGKAPPPAVQYVAVLDHQTKAAKGFEGPADALLQGADEGLRLEAAAKLQGMVKGTLKAIETAKLSDADLARLIKQHGLGETPAKLKHVMNLLKGGAAITPDAVGLTPETIDRFQAICRDAVNESLAVTKAQADAELQSHQERIRELEATGRSADRDEAQRLREEVLDSQARIHESERQATREATRAAAEKSQRLLTATEAERMALQKEIETSRQKMQEISDHELVRELDLQVQRRRAVAGDVVVQELKRPPKQPFFPLGPAPHPNDGPPTPPIGKRPGFLARPGVQRTVGWAGQGVAIYDVFSEEFRETRERMLKAAGTNSVPTNREVLRNLSYTRVAGRGILTLTGIEGAWLAGQTAKYEWVQGTRDCIDADVERYTRLGYTELPTGAALAITLKSTVRQITLSTYQGVKGIPLLGDLVGAPENLYLVTERSVGVIYDTWKSEQIVSENEHRQIVNERRAAIRARRLLGDMRTLVAGAAELRTTLANLQNSLAAIETQFASVRERFITERQLLEALLAQLPPDMVQPIPDLPIPSAVAAVQAELEACYREARGLADRCRKLERELEGGRIDCDAIRSVDPQLHQTYQDLLTRRAESQQILEHWQQQVLGAGPAADAWRLSLRLQESLAWGRDTAQSLTTAAETLPGMAKQFTTLHDNLELVRDWVLRLHTQFSPAATQPRYVRDWADILDAQQREQIDGAVRDDVLQLQRSFRRVAAELDLFGRMELPVFPAPATPRRIDGEAAASLAGLVTPLNECNRALEQTSDLLDGLDQLCPSRPPTFAVRAESAEALTVDFRVEQDRVPPNAVLVYVWNFGDEQTIPTKVPRTRHVYLRPGEYTVSVRIFHETETVSMDLGEVRTTVSVKGQPPKTPPPVVAGEERPWLATSAAWFLEDVPQLPDQSKAYDGNVVVDDFSIGFDPRGDGIELGVLQACRRFILTVNEEELVWRIDLEGRGSGRYDPGTGQFTFDLTECRVDDYLYFRRNDIPAKLHRPAAIQQTGINPDAIRWLGKFSGTLDWKNYRGSGRLDVAPLFRGRWELGGWDAVNKRMMKPEGYGVRIPVDRDLGLPNRPLPLAVLFRSVEGAKRRFQHFGGSLYPFQKSTVPNAGDEALWSPQGGMVVRDGRWCLDWSHPPTRTRSPEELRPYLERLQTYVRNSRLEELLPEQ